MLIYFDLFCFVDYTIMSTTKYNYNIYRGLQSAAHHFELFIRRRTHKSLLVFFPLHIMDAYSSTLLAYFYRPDKHVILSVGK